MASGVPILEALNITRDTSGNSVFERMYGKVSESIREGESIAKPMKEYSKPGFHPMAAGFFFFFMPVVGVLYYVVKKERGEWPFDKTRDDRSSSSVHYNGDLDLEVATTASGVLGLKGHHPRASTDAENAHPNRNAYRRKTPGSATSRTATTSSYASTAGKTVRSGASRASSKHPLGITDMKRLSSFLTPQKAKSDAMVMYDVERLTRT